jgi:hypothetical protein
MTIITLEGVVEQGQIRLKSHFHLPEQTKVYVVVPSIQIERYARIISPRLANPQEAADFKMDMAEEPSNASL